MAAMTSYASEPVRILIADDHAVVREGIRELLEEGGHLTVVAEASDGREAVRLAGELRPSVAVLDVRMPGVNGIEATRQIKATFPDIKVLILSAYDDDPYVFALLRAGADGYILKSTDADELVRAVEVVAAGGNVLAPAIAAKVVAQVTSDKPASSRDHVETLTERELDVLRLAAHGLTNKAIAAEFGVSDRTVQGNLASIYGKLAVSSRTKAVTEALKLGWLMLDAQ
jgi:DNA-binding NarL/FixJ family response regulator